MGTRPARYRATVAYDGTGYAGFQVQVDRPTVQRDIERALAQVSGETVRIAGAGRTDAGVHAQGQVVSFGSGWRHGAARLERALNAMLPTAIAVRELSEAGEQFHARYSATRRLYVYNLYQGDRREPLLDRYAHRVRGPLSLPAMQAAADLLVGDHDFAAFGQPTMGTTTVRRIFRARWLAAADGEHGSLCSIPGCSLQFQIQGTGFLRGMVRRVVGTLIAVGEQQLTVDDFGQVLESGDIAQARPPCPPCGLCLWRVDYG